MAVVLTTRALPSHIAFDSSGRAWVEGTGRKVSEIVIDHRAGLDAEQIHLAHPDLPLAKIHAALAYYFDHQSELDAEISQAEHLIEHTRAQNSGQTTREAFEARLQSGGNP